MTSPADSVTLLTGLPRELGRNDLILGSSTREALVRIGGADPVHAVITFHREGFEDGEWWIEDKGSSSGTFLNGMPLTAKTRLTEGDGITIAGVHIQYSNGWLSEDHRQARGVSVDVSGVSDEQEGWTILRSVSFMAKEGEFVGLVGPSGCGKSSVIQRIAGLAPFTAGRIAINGHPVGDAQAELRRLVAYLPQNVEDSLPAGLSVGEAMACNRRIYLAPGKDDAEFDGGIRSMLGLENEVDKTIGKLSGGQKRRVAIAFALQRNPQLLLLDEPTAGLDPATETEVMTYLRRLAVQGRTILCATHDMENLNLFHKVLVLTGGSENGRPAYFGPPTGETNGPTRNLILEHFQVASYPELFKELGKESGEKLHWMDPSPKRLEAASDPWKLPEPPAQSSFWRCVGGYMRRFSAEFRAAVFRSTKPLDRIKPVLSLLVQPVLIAVGIKWACARMFGETPMTSGGGLSTVLFCAALSVFWLGIVGSVQSLVRERIPGRCLERLAGISLARYGTAKLLALLGPCLVQTTLFSLLFFYLPELGHAEDDSLLHPSMAVGFVLFLVCFMGGLLGLAVSSFSRKTTTAVAAVPVIAILALFFSQPVIGFDLDYAADVPSAARVAHWMPCHHPQVYMCALENQTPGGDETAAQAKERFFRLFLVYSFLSLILAAAAQHCNERRWEGR